MAKGKTLNPADAYRKAQRKKELKKNKAGRSKARDFALVKKDTRDLEDEIEKLEGLTDPSSLEKTRLADLKAELNKIMAKKEEYVKENPEQRKLVYRARREKDEVKNEEHAAVEQKRNIFNKHGLPRHPERSIYYDPVMNPFGVPPPGMPYMERPLRPDEVASDGEPDVDDDVVMPEGPPPTSGNGDNIDSDDDIPMPEGPPPSDLEQPPLPPNIPLGGVPLPPPPPSLHFAQGSLPFSPPLQAPPSYPSQHPGIIEHAPQGFPLGFPPHPPSSFIQPHIPPPPGFFPRVQSASSMQDPLSSIPHQTYQAHRVNRLTSHTSVPPKPSVADTFHGTGATGMISAEPQLRDLKKEATAFVPTSLKRKKPATGMSSSRINAAPSLGGESDPLDAPPTSRPDLVSSLKDKFGPVPSVSAAPPNGNGLSKGMQPGVNKKDDYQKFVEEMGDILGAAKP